MVASVSDPVHSVNRDPGRLGEGSGWELEPAESGSEGLDSPGMAGIGYSQVEKPRDGKSMRPQEPVRRESPSGTM